MGFTDIRYELKQLIKQLYAVEIKYREMALAIDDKDLKEVLFDISSQRRIMRYKLKRAFQSMGGGSINSTAMITPFSKIFNQIRRMDGHWNMDTILHEIEHEANQLISRYDKLITKLTAHADALSLLKNQKHTIEQELQLMEEIS